MLDSLEIRNYRNLKHLRIEKLGRVNLVIGKNNTGKTSLLEAVSIFVANNKLQTIDDLLEQRGELEAGEKLKSFPSLFFNREISFYDRQKDIFIGNIDSDRWYLRLVKRVYSDEYNFVLVENKIDERKDVKIKEFFSIESLRHGYEESDLHLSRSYDDSDYYLDGQSEAESFHLIKSNQHSKDENHELWGRVSMFPNEKFVLEGLRIIEPKINQFNYILQYSEPVARVKVDDGRVLPLRSMGDGINRILTIILAMVNCENGYLLIDEFENGLHYLVQEKLWEIVFQLSERLNIQVFVTTHSNDSIRTFENVVNRDAVHPANGILIKLDNIEGTIEATVFEPDELKFITDNFIEAR